VDNSKKEKNNRDSDKTNGRPRLLNKKVLNTTPQQKPTEEIKDNVNLYLTLSTEDI
jgi:hypothetical protein